VAIVIDDVLAELVDNSAIGSAAWLKNLAAQVIDVDDQRPSLPEQCGNRRLPHADPSGEADDGCHLSWLS
jgi:hypothetical protein